MLYTLGEHEPKLADATVYVAPTAAVIGRVRLEAESSVWFSAVLRGDVEDIIVGRGSNIQDGAVIHADPGFPCRIGASVTIGHLAMVHGCSVGDGVMIGIHATVLNGAQIGKGSLIGAHALVPEGKIIPPNSVVLGVPGKIVRTVDDRDRAFMDAGARHYCANGSLFAEKLRRIG